MRIVAIAGALVAAGASASADPANPCDDAAVTVRLSALVRSRRFSDTHHAVVGMRALCGEAPASEAWRLLDDVALIRLEDREWALRDLHALADHGSHVAQARLLLAWTYTTEHDRQAADAMLALIPPPRAAAIEALAAIDDAGTFASWTPKLAPELAAPAREIWKRYDAAAHTKRPALAGVLSAILPGAGQLYSGSPQAAAVAFVLNGLFIAATVEQAMHHDYATAAAAGTVASFFYVGGVINAVDLARRRNRMAADPLRDDLERLLVPEVDGAIE